MNRLNIRHIVNRVFNSMTYIIECVGCDVCWLVDCGDVGDVIASNKKVGGVFLTHSHYDHIYGLNSIVEAFPEITVYTNDFGYEALMDPRKNLSRYHPDVEDFIFRYRQNIVKISDGDRIFLFDGSDLSVMETPGHDPSCLSYLVGNALFTGDAYIPGVKTVTSFPHSDKLLAAESIARLENLLNEATFYPGHFVSSFQI